MLSKIRIYHSHNCNIISVHNYYTNAAIIISVKKRFPMVYKLPYNYAIYEMWKLRLRDTVAYRASASASFRLSNPNSAKFTSARYYYS